MPPLPFSHRLRVAHLNPRQPTPITLSADQAALGRIAEDLGIIGVRKLTLDGTLRAEGHEAWAFDGRIDAQVVQSCVVTLTPVPATLSEPVRRVWSAHAASAQDMAEQEIEMPDESVEPLGQFIDLGDVAVETLALALPLYPRAKGAALPDSPDADAGRGHTRKPFADLAALMSKKAGDA